MKVIYAVVVENGKRVRRPLALKPRICEECGTEFEPKKQISRYCSLHCSNKAERKRHSDRAKMKAKEYYANNLDKCREQRKRYYWSDPERFRAATREWNKNNREAKSMRDNKYKDLVRHGGLKEELIKSNGCICGECGKEADTYTIVAHHVTLNNQEHEQQKLLCRSCHMRLHQTIHSNLPQINSCSGSV